jgi:hypothetical protein
MRALLRDVRRYGSFLTNSVCLGKLVAFRLLLQKDSNERLEDSVAVFAGYALLDEVSFTDQVGALSPMVRLAMCSGGRYSSIASLAAEAVSQLESWFQREIAWRKPTCGDLFP